MAYHPFDTIMRLIAADAWYLATPKCRQDVLSLGLTEQDVGQLLGRLRGSDYRGEFGPCSTDFGAVMGDYYEMWIDPSAIARCPPKQGTKLYIKLGIHADENTVACLVVSFHEAIR